MKSIDWNEPELKKWMDSIRSQGTKNSYKLGYSKFFKFSGNLPASQRLEPKQH